MNLEAILQKGMGPGTSRLEHLIKAREGVHDSIVAHTLGTAAAWSYADLHTFSRAMCFNARLGMHEAVGVSITNSALLVDSAAYLVQSMDKRLTILSFRGTDFKNVTNWIGDMTTNVDPFFSSGHVHGGFYRSTLALWRSLDALLKAARSGSICEAAMRERATSVDCIEESLPRDQEDRAATEINPAPGSRDGRLDPSTQGTDEELEALYICGHSLGGAMAVIAAALLYKDPELADLAARLRGVYTFGQPMVGHLDFAKAVDKDFGHKLFRHVQNKDLVPRLPPRTTGDFAHSGSELVSTSTGWIPQTKIVSAVGSILSSLTVGTLAWIQHQLPSLAALRWLPLRWSIRDHGPIYYLRTSQSTGVGAEFL